MRHTSPHLIMGGMQHRALLGGNDSSYFFGFPIATVHLEGFPPAYHCTWCMPLKKKYTYFEQNYTKGHDKYQAMFCCYATRSTVLTAG